MTQPRTVESYLSRLARQVWPTGIVFHEGGTNYLLQREGMDDVGLGPTFGDAREALRFLIENHKRGTP